MRDCRVLSHKNSAVCQDTLELNLTYFSLSCTEISGVSDRKCCKSEIFLLATWNYKFLLQDESRHFNVNGRYSVLCITYTKFLYKVDIFTSWHDDVSNLMVNIMLFYNCFFHRRKFFKFRLRLRAYFNPREGFFNLYS